MSCAASIADDASSGTPRRGPSRTRARHRQWRLAARPGTVGNLVRGAGFPSGSDEAIAEHDGKLGLSLGPFAGRHFPLLSDLAQDQENELGRRLVAGEMASRPHGPSQLGVQGLDSIRGVDDFAHGRSEGEERNDLLPLSPRIWPIAAYLRPHEPSSKASKALRPASASAAR